MSSTWSCAASRSPGGPRWSATFLAPTRTEPALAGIERAFAAKYFAGAEQMFHDARHAWLRVTPTKIVSWDFRKLAG